MWLPVIPRANKLWHTTAGNSLISMGPGTRQTLTQTLSPPVTNSMTLGKQRKQKQKHKAELQSSEPSFWNETCIDKFIYVINIFEKTLWVKKFTRYSEK